MPLVSSYGSDQQRSVIYLLSGPLRKNFANALTKTLRIWLGIRERIQNSSKIKMVGRVTPYTRLALPCSLESFVYLQQKHVWVLYLTLWQEMGRDAPQAVRDFVNKKIQCILQYSPHRFNDVSVPIFHPSWSLTFVAGAQPQMHYHPQTSQHNSCQTWLNCPDFSFKLRSYQFTLNSHTLLCLMGHRVLHRPNWYLKMNCHEINECLIWVVGSLHIVLR